MRETTPDLTRISKYISLILRHKPEVIGIQLDAHGWADVNALLAGISKKYSGGDREERQQAAVCFQ